MKYAMKFALVVFSVAMMVLAAAAQEKAKPASDEQLIQGHWVAVESSDRGKEMPNPGEVHAVFTDKEVKISSPRGGAAWEYHLDPSSDPKHCDLGGPMTIMPFRASYRLEGDTLLLAFPISSRGTYPTNFEPAEGMITHRFRRAEAARPASAKATTAEETEELKDLRKDIKEMSGLLEAKKYQEFCDRAFTVEQQKKMGPKGLEGAVEHLKKAGPSSSSSSVSSWSSIRRSTPPKHRPPSTFAPSTSTACRGYPCSASSRWRTSGTLTRSSRGMGRETTFQEGCL